jgi:hypothetical protein
MLVDSACKGLLIEGEEAGKLKQAMWMEEQLITVKNGTERDIAETCARLYAMDSFLYRKLNECMRLQGDNNYGNFWRSKVSTLGPFAYLFRDLSTLTMNSRKATVYRGMDLCDDLIKQLIEMKEGEKCSLPAFTSTSRNREKAEFISGNVLVEIDIDDGFDGWDISSYSDFDEEEFLLEDNCNFTFISCKRDSSGKDKWIIHLQSQSYAKLL